MMAMIMAATMAAIVVVAATVIATGVCVKDNGSDSDGRGHRQQSIKSGSKDMVVVATAMETAAAGTAMTAAGAPATIPGIGADGIVFATAAGATTTGTGTATSVASAARIAWLVFQVGGSAHSAVLAPLVGGGACPTFPVGSRGGGGHDGRVVGAGCKGCTWGCACWLCVCCKPLMFC
jgi:hypothetical protein